MSLYYSILLLYYSGFEIPARDWLGRETGSGANGVAKPGTTIPVGFSINKVLRKFMSTVLILSLPI